MGSLSKLLCWPVCDVCGGYSETPPFQGSVSFACDEDEGLAGRTALAQI